MIIRPLDPERELIEFLAIADQRRRVRRDLETWRRQERRAGTTGARRHLVGVLDGRLVAAATVADHPFLSGARAIRLVVDAAHRRRGLGRAMWSAVEVLAGDAGPAVLDVGVLDDDPESVGWAERRGFRVVSHTIRSRLDLDRFERDRHQAAVSRAEQAGVRFEPPDDDERLFRLHTDLFRDVPDPLEPPGREQFRRQVQADGIVTLVAIRDGEWVGLTIMSVLQRERALNDFTGVVRAARNAGLARALKVLAIDEARRRGLRWMETSNNADNGPMLAVNRALGFERVEGELFLRRPPPGRD